MTPSDPSGGPRTDAAAGLTGQLDRARARLARERAARRESEDIAESSLRRLYHHQQQLELLSRVASLANSASDASQAYREAMDLIRATNSWRVGHYLVPAKDDASVMVSSGQWSGEPGDAFLRELQAATAGMRFPPGIGLPGRAYRDGPSWVENIRASDNFPRQQWIKGGAGFAFPILIGDEVVAVIEFIHPTPRPADTGLLELAAVLGTQLGRVLERTRGVQREAQHRTALREAVERRTADLIDARNRAEAQSQARATLFSTVSHDLQTPLHTAIAELRAAAGGITGEAELHLRKVARELTELQQRIDALVDLTGGKEDLVDRPRVVDLGRVLTDVVQAHLAARAGAEAPPRVSIAASANHPVLVDVERFTRIVHTLLAARLVDNMTAGVELRLEVRTVWAVITMTGAVPDVAGTSLELTRQLAAAAGGTVVATQPGAAPGKIEVQLPVAVQGQQRRGRGNRVLVVDDIAVTRQISAAMLTRLGAEVLTAEHGQAALAALRQQDVALVLMDLRMPVMGGLEAARRIRSGESGPERSSVPIVALTAHAAAGDSEQSLLAGMDAHMTKPFTLEDLRAVVARYAPDAVSAASPG